MVDGKKTVLVQIKLTQEQKERLRALADAQGLTMTQYIRWILFYRKGDKE